jgi:glycosidase
VNPVRNIWARKPFIYEINTRVWLTELSRRCGTHINLYNVPDEILDELAAYKFDAVWLMGIWTRGEATWRSALNYVHEYRHALPDIREIDVAGSAYAIHYYEVEPLIGGRAALAQLRSRLRQRGIKLILDYVPNHVATDHPWIRTNPNYFVHRSVKALKRFPGMFFRAHDQHGNPYAVAHGRDPYFPSWIDTAQLNAFDPGLRQQVIHTLRDIASQCDGVRCDMAMLMLNGVFNQTWGSFIDDPTPEVEFWDEVVPAVRQMYPDFLLMAEVYWGLEYTLQQQGFDYTYDKTLYDRLFTEDVSKVRVHLEAALAFQQRSVRFIENHDEPRAAASYGVEKSKVAATLVCTLPGAVLLHDGQFTGRRVKLPVHIARQPDEPRNADLEAFYRKLLKAARDGIFQNGQWRLLNTEHGQILAYGWRQGDNYRLIIANLSRHQAQDALNLIDWTGSAAWTLKDMMNTRRRSQVNDGIVSVALEAYESRIFRLERIAEKEKPDKSDKPDKPEKARRTTAPVPT